MIKLKQLLFEQYSKKPRYINVRQLKSNDYELIYGQVDNEEIYNIKDLTRFTKYVIVPAGFAVPDSEKKTDNDIIDRANRQLKQYIGNLTPTYAIISTKSDEISTDDGVLEPGRIINIIYPEKQSPNTNSNRAVSEKLLTNWEKGLFQNSEQEWILYAKANFTKLYRDQIRALGVRELIKRLIELKPELTKQQTTDLRYKLDLYINKSEDLTFWIFDNDRTDAANSNYDHPFKPGEWNPHPSTLDNIKDWWVSGAFYVELTLPDETFRALLDPNITKYTFDHPRGTYTDYFVTGDKWVGEYHQNKDGKTALEGDGVYTDVDGNVYDGTFKDNYPVNVLVKYTYGDGATYEGRAIGDPERKQAFLRHGDGVFVNKDGEEYRGKFVNDKFIDNK